MSFGLEILAVVLLIVINGLLAMAELAVVSASRPRLKLLADRGSHGAKVALALAEDTASFLSTVQIGITLIGVLAGAVGGSTLAEHLGKVLNQMHSIAPHGETVAMGIVVSCITLLSIVIGELVPKQFALRHPERIAVVVAPVLRGLLRLSGPAVRVLDVASGWVLALLGVSGESGQAITEEEVRAAIHEGARAGVLKQLEKEMLSGVMRLADRRVELIMTELDDLATIDLDQPAQAVLQAAAQAGHSRLVAVRGGPREVVGVLLVRDLLSRALTSQPEGLETLLCHPPEVGLDLPATEALALLRGATGQMLFVVDAEGHVAGMVTVADVLKCIIGELADSPTDEPAILERESGSWLIDGEMLIDVVADRLGLVSLPEERHFDSLAGFLLWRLERLPEEGERVQFDGYRFEVVDMDGPRIDKVMVTRLTDVTHTHDELAGG